MIVQLVSYKSTLRAGSRLHHTAEIINSSKADLILFAGHTLASHWDIDELNTLIDLLTMIKQQQLLRSRIMQ